MNTTTINANIIIPFRKLILFVLIPFPLLCTDTAIAVFIALNLIWFYILKTLINESIISTMNYIIISYTFQGILIHLQIFVSKKDASIFNVLKTHKRRLSSNKTGKYSHNNNLVMFSFLPNYSINHC